MTLRRNDQRRSVQHGRQTTWQTFFAEDPPGPLADGFGCLVALDETRLPPGDSTESHPTCETELVTYVHRGALSQEDTEGNARLIQPGEFQRMSTGGGICHKETSVSPSDWVHMFRISLRPLEAGLNRLHEQKRFTAAQRRNLLCVVASPDRRNGSLRIHRDVVICATILEPGHHLVHELEPGRSAWIHLVYGVATLDGTALTRGDGVGVANQPSVSITVQEHTEMLLIDTGPARRKPQAKTSSGGRSSMARRSSGQTS